MADNVTINKTTVAGGENIATDLITDGGVAGGAQVQRIKQGFGTDGKYTEISATNPLPITIGNNTASIEVLMSIECQLRLISMQLNYAHNTNFTIDDLT